MDKLLPCPFCGGEAALRELYGFGQYVRCTRCRAGGPVKPKPLLTEAIAAWNRRADAVPVVRCKECEYYNITCCSDGCGWCERMDRGVHDDFYCSNGERKESEGST
jgi:Lar family restriction alleviation protein